MSFFLGESESNVSGVLCCCSAAVVLAIYAKPIINNHEALEEVWHAIEYFGNTVLFFIAGVVIQRAIFGYDPFIKIGTTVPELFTARDYGLLLAFYLVVMLIRLLMMVIFCKSAPAYFPSLCPFWMFFIGCTIFLQQTRF